MAAQEDATNAGSAFGPAVMDGSVQASCAFQNLEEKQLFNMKGQESEDYHLKKNGKKQKGSEEEKTCHRSAQAKTERPAEVTIVPGVA